MVEPSADGTVVRWWYDQRRRQVIDGGVVGGGGMMMGRSYGRPDLFYNFYSQGYANQLNAQMYMSPLPVPPNVGHTFYTYQPFYPHEMLYWHKDRFIATTTTGAE